MGDGVERTGIDVKNEDRRIDMEMLDALAAKRKKLDLDRYVVISTSGYSAAAKEEGEHEKPHPCGHASWRRGVADRGLSRDRSRWRASAGAGQSGCSNGLLYMRFRRQTAPVEA